MEVKAAAKATANNTDRPLRNPTKVVSEASSLDLFKSFITTAITIYFAISSLRKQDPASHSSSATMASTQLYDNGTVFEPQCHITEDGRLPDFNNPTEFVWNLTGLTLGDLNSGENHDSNYSYAAEIWMTEEQQKNGSYLYVFLQTAAEKEEILPFCHPNSTIDIVIDYIEWIKGAVPEPIDKYVEFTSSGRIYKPIVFFSDNRNLVKHKQQFNSIVKLTWQPLSLTKWGGFIAKSTKSQTDGGSLREWAGDDGMEEGQDSIKMAILVTRPYLFCMIIFLHVLPTIFRILDLKNEIHFWRERQSLEGLSVRFIFFNVFQSLIVLLYVLDNETSILLKVSSCLRLGVEVWIILKVVDVKIDLQNSYMGFIPVRISVKSSYMGSNTKEYDAYGFRSLSWAVYSLLVAYAIYSFDYEEQQGWYSSVISMLNGYLFNFGFLMLIPQLFINYKLKSVAHLPWRMMTYKALHTFLDDLIASVTKRPSRSCVRNLCHDIIFLVFLYQRWIYRVGPSRLNKCGLSKRVLKACLNVLFSDPVIKAVVDPLIQDEVMIAPEPKALEQKKKE